MTDVFKQHTRTVRELLKCYNKELSKLYIDDNLEEIWTSHDNLYGGIDYFNLKLYITVDLYIKLQNEEIIKEAEEKIYGFYQDILKGEESIQLQNVFISPKSEAVGSINTVVSDSMWKPGFFRLFISHLSANKESACGLKQELIKFGVDCFVAHEDIQPSKEWQTEIENALFSMDALCAIVVEDFIKSEWCDQEVGIALGQRKVVFPIKKNAVPYGFFGKYQALPGVGKYCNQMAVDVLNAIANNENTKDIYLGKLILLILNVRDEQTAKEYLSCLSRCENINRRHIETLHEHLLENNILKNGSCFEISNSIFDKYGLSRIIPFQRTMVDFSNKEDLPF